LPWSEAVLVGEALTAIAHQGEIGAVKADFDQR
jgi:hypothetical protein